MSNTIALLGLVADHRRNIKSGKEYNHLFPSSDGSYEYVTMNGTVRRTVTEMEKFVKNTASDTAKLAPYLKGKDLRTTCENIWNFIYQHIQYKLDKDGVEELRRPRRSWADRFTGVDCDCMSIFASSVLTNLGIDHKFRITAYSGDWQHVYVIVPLPENKDKYWVIDPVLNEFNYQKPFSKNFDYKMKAQPTFLGGIPIAMLGGFGDRATLLANDLNDVVTGLHIKGIEEDYSLGSDGEALLNEKPFLDSILQHIKATRDYIAKNPDAASVIGGAKNHLKMLDYAIAHWNTPNRDKALDALAEAENKWNGKQAMSGVEDAQYTIDALAGIDDSDVSELLEGLGKLNIKGAGQKFFNNVKSSVQTVTSTVKKTNQNIINKAKEVKSQVDEKAKAAAKKAIEKTKEVAKKAGEAIKKFVVWSNPLTLLMRAGFLLAMKVNLFGMAERLLPAQLTKEEAAKRNVPEALWLRSKAGYDKVAKVFEAIGGARSKLEKYIREGLAGKKKTLAGLSGEPYTTAAAIVAAAATLITAAAKMREAGVNKRDYEQLKRNEAARQNTRSVKGFGADGEAPITDEANSQPNTDAASSDGSEVLDEMPVSEEQMKSGSNFFAKFVQAIKKWFGKNKGVADQPAQDVIAEEQAATSETPVDSYKQQEVITAEQAYKEAETAAAINPSAENSKRLEELKARYEALKSGSTGGGFFQKVGNFVKENPGKTAVGAVLVTGVLVYAFSPKARAAVGNMFSSKKPKLKPALGAVEVYRKGKKVKRPKRMLPKNSTVKRVVLK